MFISEKPTTVEIEKKYAILIGINNHLDDIIRSLSYSVADVKSLYEVLIDPNRGSYNQENTRLMIDESPQPELTPIRSNIMSQISSLSSMASTRDQLLLYFSGHGIEKNGRSFLLPQDARYNILDETAISIKWMKKTFISSNARVKILIFDACHSGAIKGKAASGSMTKGLQESIFPAPEGFAILSSCKMNEVSWEDEELGRSVFSYFLTEGLKGAADYDQDLKVTITEANKYTFEKVSSWALSSSRSQSPNLECSIYGDVVLCQVPSDFVPLLPVTAPIKNIRLSSETFAKKKFDGIINKLCGLLLNFVEPSSIISENSIIRFDGGHIEKKGGPSKLYVDISFDYTEKTSKTIDMIISELDNTEILKFDEIEFVFSGGTNIDRVVKACKKRGIKILSFDPSSKKLEIELPSNIPEENTVVSFQERDEGSSVLFRNVPAYFKKDFYERINPTFVVEFLGMVQNP